MYRIFHLGSDGNSRGFSEGPDFRFLGFGFIQTMNQLFDLWSETHEDDDGDNVADDDNDGDDDDEEEDLFSANIIMFILQQLAH